MMKFEIPNEPMVGQLFTGPNNTVFRWSGMAWETVDWRAAGRTPTITMSPTPPDLQMPGDFWFNIDNGFLYIWYDDGTTVQWVVANPGRGTLEGPPGQTGAPGKDSPVQEAPENGQEYVRQDATWAVLRLAVQMQNYMWFADPAPPPVSGEMRCNAAKTQLYFNKISGTGMDTSHFFNDAFTAGHKVFVQDRFDTTKWMKFSIATTAADSGTYWTLGVTLLEEGSAMTTSRVAVALI